MEIIKFFCLILASSLLLVQTTLSQSTAEEKTTIADITTVHSTTPEEITTKPSEDTSKSDETTVTKRATEDTVTKSSSETTKPSSEPTKPDTETKITPEKTTPTSEPTKSTTELTKSSTEKTTTHPTEPPTTVAPPDFTWEVKRNDENKTVCLKVHVQLSFKNNESSEPFELFSNASVDKRSDCGKENKSQIIVLTYLDKTVNLTFSKNDEDKEKTTYYLSLLTFENNTEVSELNGTGQDYMIGHLKKSYKCNDDATHSMTKGVTVTWKNVQVQAYMDESDKGDFGSAEECTQDQTSDVVPIAVGCALAGLVIIVLIAYLVGRRRSRQKGYQSV